MRLLGSIAVAVLLSLVNIVKPLPTSSTPLPLEKAHQRETLPFISSPPFHIQEDLIGTLTSDGESANKVPIILGVMSRCPDAELCEDIWDRVLDRVGPLIDISLVYIGELDSSSRYGVSCKHGELECTGNIQQLCAAEKWFGGKGAGANKGELLPWGDWWNFVQCMNYGPTSRIGDHSVARQCASIVGHDWDAEVQSCVTGSEGEELLQTSVKQAKTLRIEKSCTILINGRKVCVHDSNWKQCPGGHEVGDFAQQVKDEWNSLNGNRQ